MHAMTTIITIIITFHFHSFPLLLFHLEGSGCNEFRQPEDCFRELCRNKHFFKQLKLISSDLSISMRLPVKTSIGCLSWTQKQKLGSHQRPPQSPPNLSSFLSLLGLLQGLLCSFHLSKCGYCHHLKWLYLSSWQEQKDLVSLVILTFAQLARKRWISGAAQVTAASFSWPSVKSSSPPVGRAWKTSLWDLRVQKTYWPFLKINKDLSVYPGVLVLRCRRPAMRGLFIYIISMLYR